MLNEFGFTGVNLCVNNKCDAKCIYCQYPSGKDEMTGLIMSYTIDMIREMNINSVHFFGKEPTLSWKKCVRPIIEELGQFYSYGVTTNGRQLSRDKNNIISDLAEYNFDVLLSYDGMLQHLNRGISDKVINSAVINLEQHDITPLALCCVTPAQVPSLFNSIEKIYSMGFWGVALNKVVTGLPNLNYNWNLLRREYRRVLDYFGNMFDFKLTLFERHRDVWSKSNHALFKASKHRNTCGACWAGIGIDYTGTIFPCQHPCYNLGMNIGHVATGISWKKVCEVRNYDFVRCKSCPIFPCSGCYIDNYDVHGDIFKLNRLGCKFEAVIREIELQYLRDNGHEFEFLTPKILDVVM